VTRKNWIGHILRVDGLLKDVLEGRMEGKRPRGRIRMEIIDQLQEGSFSIMNRRAKKTQKGMESLGAKYLPLGRTLMMMF